MVSWRILGCAYGPHLEARHPSTHLHLSLGASVGCLRLRLSQCSPAVESDSTQGCVYMQLQAKREEEIREECHGVVAFLEGDV